MMFIDEKTYRDKLKGCWIGKNVGGTLGAPFEGFRQWNEISFFQQDLSQGPPPNDDLDLQLVWLAAVERYGRAVNARILADYWLSYVIPNWVEYGMAKANLRAGLEPPLSGHIENPYKNSCGAFIRTEIWACLAPGHPEIAARYAYEDASVDHQGEGIYGAVFFAALQSAAFVESDRERLLEIALSYIPQDCAVSHCVQAARRAYAEGHELKKAREIIHNTAPGTFGIQQDSLDRIPLENNSNMALGQVGFDAPENIGFAIAGWFYGEGDFGQSLCMTVACGEDTDCTAASLGATLGIIQGAKALPAKWVEALNDRIETICVDKTSRGIWVPNTVTELSTRIANVMPGFLGAEYYQKDEGQDFTVLCLSPEQLHFAPLPLLANTNGAVGLRYDLRPLASTRSEYLIQRDFAAFSLSLDYIDSIFWDSEGKKDLKIIVTNNIQMCQQQWCYIKLYLPDNVRCLPLPSVTLPLNNVVGAQAVFSLTLHLVEAREGKTDVIIDAGLLGRHSSGQIRLSIFSRTS